MSKKIKDLCTCTEECAKGYNPNCTCESSDCFCREGECLCGDNCECNEESTCRCNEEDKLHTDKLNEAYNKISELEDKLIRQNADVINFRKRKEEEVNKMLKFCNEDIVKELLPILDNFERAIHMEDGLTEREQSFLDGFKMVYSHLQNVMEKFEVKMIDGSNKPFDPIYHNAIMVEKRDDMEPGMVIEVLQKGYLLKDKVIRTAMVRVSE